jgi:hypothetical protein
MNDHDTGYHDHDLSAAGDTFTFGPADIHRVSHAGSEPAITAGRSSTRKSCGRSAA